MTAFFGGSKQYSDKYGPSHPQQKAINKGIIDDLIIKCNMPISIVENEHFRHFLSILDHKYTPMARTTVSHALDKKVEEVKKTLLDRLCTVKTVNLTIDIWSDRRMRAFLGITAHYMSASSELQSSLLSCERFTGSHTGERIAGEIDTVLNYYQLRQKIDFVVTDNAANMRKAMTVAFTEVEPEDQENDCSFDVDDPDVWNTIEDEDTSEVNGVIESHCRRERLSCFDHTLHLTVGDGLKESRCASAAIAKASKLASMLHTSSLFRDAFENCFGKNKGIPAAVSTRWNSTMRQIKSILDLDFKMLSDMLEAQGLKNLVFSMREWSQLGELVDILEPFLEATTLTEGDKVVTLSFALPSVVALIRHLRELQQSQRVKVCSPICKALLTSLNQRFEGMLRRIHLINTRQGEQDDSVTDSVLPYGADIYVIATFFDIRFRLMWIDDLPLTTAEKQLLRQQVIGNYTSTIV